MGRKLTSVMIDEELLKEAKKAGINLTETLTNALKEMLGQEAPKRLTLDDLPEWEKENTIAILNKDLKFLRGRVKYIANTYGIYTTEKELYEWFMKNRKGDEKRWIEYQQAYGESFRYREK